MLMSKDQFPETPSKTEKILLEFPENDFSSAQTAEPMSFCPKINILQSVVVKRSDESNGLENEVSLTVLNNVPLEEEPLNEKN